MDPIVLPLGSPEAGDSKLCGNKAAALSVMIGEGISVPDGFVIATPAYRLFVKENDLEGIIVMETARKPLDQMRWEEMWDASLRIRNGFMRGRLPGRIEDALKNQLGSWMKGKSLAVRSSSLLEDAAGTSFAGLHESVINVRNFQDLVEALLSVWASLWSDAVLAYARELELEKSDAAMAVVVQELVEGESSGVAFGVDPSGRSRSIIEAVFGLNKGMVDGDVQPDRWILDRQSGEVLSIERAEHERRVIAGREGTTFEKLEDQDKDRLPLSEQQAGEIFGAVRKVEDIFGSPQDMEWTIRDGSLYLLQSRPVTTGRIGEDGDRRSFDLSLRKSFNTLSEMSGRITEELIPGMISEADEISATDPASLDDGELAGEIMERSRLFKKWKNIYWDDFIPFAHGVRLFGRIYNDRVKPDDPYQFVDLLSASETLSVKRNRKLVELAGELADNPDLNILEPDQRHSPFDKKLEEFISDYGGLSCEGGGCRDEKSGLLSLLRELAGSGRLTAGEGAKRKSSSDTDRLAEKFLESFPEEEKEYASELLEIARESYRIRDDDNIYLGRFERSLNEVMEEGKKRLGSRCGGSADCEDPEALARALRDPDYTLPEKEAGSEEIREAGVTARQLRGQPAGSGIARGTARVAIRSEDLFDVREGEILVCDAIDPNMTFVIPLVAGIVERRGGMLVHGAIVAREYGLPCVTGVADATRVIDTGDSVTVDGYDGLVIIHRD
ncbi:MAG: hypothetical protein GF417_07900 [Candidatus Latescibacteria bacterium]|nr:hypothetical protein [bacterium]MBD3424343.1 hypothetical protein [Candidatus Latescibacterota bacterium]